MERCIALAQNARGYTSPNPMVGSVVVCNDKIIGEGWHHRAGEPHAEVNAINSVKDKDKLSSSTIYVSLEPCAHHGKTPPCADLIIENKIPNVVIGCRDPFHEVNGRGIEKLKAAGVNVVEGILQKKCRSLNRFFFTYHQEKRPYIILKWAQSSDGFIDGLRSENQKGVNWITHARTKTLVHQCRAEVDAILVGKTTVINDDPSLTVREVEGTNPIRIVIDPQKRLEATYKVFNNEASTYHIHGLKVGTKQNHQIYIDFDKNPLSQLMAFCYDKGIQSLIVEGGAHTLQAFIDSKLWDEALVFTGKSVINQGLKAPKLNENQKSTAIFGHDLINIFLK